MTVLVTVERYIAVCWPFHVKTLLTIRNSIWWTAGVLVSSIIYNFPRFFENWNVKLGNHSVLESKSFYIHSSPIHVQYTHGWMKTTVHYIITFFILVVLNFLIWRKVSLQVRNEILPLSISKLKLKLAALNVDMPS